MRRLRLVVAVAVAIGLAPLACNAIGPADQAAMDKASASLKWLADFKCPSLGLPLNVKAMQTEAETTAQQQSSWAFAENAVDALRTPLAQREEVLRKAKRGDNYDAALAEMDGQLQATMARIGTALVNWSLANWVELSKVDGSYPYPATGPHPLASFVQRDSALQTMVRNTGQLPGAQDYLQPVGAKFHQCLVVLQNQVVERNADSLRVAINAATRSSDLPNISRAYAVVEPSFAAPGVTPPDVIQALRAQGDTLRERERVAAEAEARRQAELARAAEARGGSARGGSPGRPAAAEPPADLQAQLRAATAVVQALSSRSVQDALRHMHDEVVLTSPLGTAQGKTNVASALQQGFSSGRSGSIGPPFIQGSQIVAPVQSPRGNATMTFSFKDNLVSALRIR